MILKILLALAIPAMVTAGGQLSIASVDRLIELRENTREWALLCPPGTSWAGQRSMYDGDCAQGDVTMFNGMSCISATLAEDYRTAGNRCFEAAVAQEPGGRWTRGPQWVHQDYPDGDFSRDQTRGAFATLIARGLYLNQLSEAQESARSWLEWIEANNNMICAEDTNKCYMRTGVHNLFFNTYRHLGVLPSKSHSALVRKFYNSQWYLTWGMNAELRTLWVETDLRDKWYPVHIKAADILINRVLNMNPDFTVRNCKIAHVLGAAAKYIQNKDALNLFYQFLRYGNNEFLVKNVLSLCPREKPVLVNQLHDWAWQRGSHEKAWERSDGHDWIFLINLMLAQHYGRLNWSC